MLIGFNLKLNLEIRILFDKKGKQYVYSVVFDSWESPVPRVDERGQISASEWLETPPSWCEFGRGGGPGPVRASVPGWRRTKFMLLIKGVISLKGLDSCNAPNTDIRAAPPPTHSQRCTRRGRSQSPHRPPGVHRCAEGAASFCPAVVQKSISRREWTAPRR